MSSKLLTNLKIFTGTAKERKEKKKGIGKDYQIKEKSPRGNGNLDYHGQILNLDNRENRTVFDRNRSFVGCLACSRRLDQTQLIDELIFFLALFL